MNTIDGLIETPAGDIVGASVRGDRDILFEPEDWTTWAGIRVAAPGLLAKYGAGLELDPMLAGQILGPMVATDGGNTPDHP